MDITFITCYFNREIGHNKISTYFIIKLHKNYIYYLPQLLPTNCYFRKILDTIRSLPGTDNILDRNKHC